MPVGLVAAGVGAAGAIGGAVISSNAAKSAANTEANAANASIAEQQREFNATQQEQAPFLTTGTSALDTLAQIYGLSTAAPGATDGSSATAADPSKQADYSSFYNSPDYQFALSQGLKGVQASAAANGSLESGATDKAEETYAGNLATQNFNDYATRLSQLAGVGASSANVSTNANQAQANAVTGINTNAADNEANLELSAGNSTSNALNSLLGGVNSQGRQSSYLSSLIGYAGAPASNGGMTDLGSIPGTGTPAFGGVPGYGGGTIPIGSVSSATPAIPGSGIAGGW